MGAIPKGLADDRPHDRYTRLTVGRSNANHNFARNYFPFAIQELAIYEQFTVTYNIRNLFALIGEPLYYNKLSSITRMCIFLNSFSIIM